MTKSPIKKPMKRPNESMLVSLFTYLENHISKEGFAPSVRELAADNFIGHETANRYLWVMAARGWITRQPRRPRAIEIVFTPLQSI